ncbi:hypothetical protein BP5796_03019 [Coleophoma crateriformis]|uniref:Uncharacterized protein n=1 Tax=Coleophoma crateriformis TaxID=565419 RepID=A0A3D8SLX7_9HELO|nr:hypothetical protein BP5796_03019 [Coleophoma crateriformis]
MSATQGTSDPVWHAHVPQYQATPSKAQEPYLPPSPNQSARSRTAPELHVDGGTDRRSRAQMILVDLFSSLGNWALLVRITAEDGLVPADPVGCA